MNDPVRTDEEPEPASNAPVDTRIQVSVTESAGVVTVRPIGEIDILTASVLHERLWPCLETSGQTVLLDLTEVGFLGSAGLSELVAAHATATRNGVRLRLVASSRAVLRPLDITGLLPLFEVFDSVDTALGEV